MHLSIYLLSSLDSIWYFSIRTQLTTSKGLRLSKKSLSVNHHPDTCNTRLCVSYQNLLKWWILYKDRHTSKRTRRTLLPLTTGQHFPFNDKTKQQWEAAAFSEASSRSAFQLVSTGEEWISCTAQMPFLSLSKTVLLHPALAKPSLTTTGNSDINQSLRVSLPSAFRLKLG